jgi:hypothetical protein
MGVASPSPSLECVIVAAQAMPACVVRILIYTDRWCNAAFCGVSAAFAGNCA